MANDEVIGPRKTMFVLVIVVGCFAVLWPRILSPLVLGPSREQIQPNQFDREAGCCEVIFETDVAVLELVNEVCSTALGAGKLLSHSAAECRKAVNDTCGVDIAVFLKRNENVGKTTKMLVETMQNSNSSCLREHFGVPIYSLGPHLAANSWNMKDTLKQERASPIRGMGPHPALRERGRAIPPGPPGPPPPPASRPVTLPPHIRVRSPLSVYYENEQPPPIPGMRPPLGSPGGPVPAPKSSMGFVMPIYTICIIVFFVYTLTKILFRRQGAPYEPIPPDPQFRRRVFRDDSRSSPEKLGKKEADTIVTAISGLVAEVQQQMEASGAPSQQRQDVQDNARPYTNGTILLNSGPVHIVTSEYKEYSKEKTPEPVLEKESTPEPKDPEPIKVVVRERCSEVDEPISKQKDYFPEVFVQSPPEPEITLEENKTISETVVVRKSSPEPLTEECKEPFPKLKESTPEPETTQESTPESLQKPFDAQFGVDEKDLPESPVQSKESTQKFEIIQDPTPKSDTNLSDTIPVFTVSEDIAMDSDTKFENSSELKNLRLKESSPENEELTVDPKDLSTVLLEQNIQIKESSVELNDLTLELKEPYLELPQSAPESVLTSSEPEQQIQSKALVTDVKESEEPLTEPKDSLVAPTDLIPELKDHSIESKEPTSESKDSSPKSEDHLIEFTKPSLESQDPPSNLSLDHISALKSEDIPSVPITKSVENLLEFEKAASQIRELSPQPIEASSETEEPVIESKEPLQLERTSDLKHPPLGHLVSTLESSSQPEIQNIQSTKLSLHSEVTSEYTETSSHPKEFSTDSKDSNLECNKPPTAPVLAVKYLLLDLVAEPKKDLSESDENMIQSEKPSLESQVSDPDLKEASTMPFASLSKIEKSLTEPKGLTPDLKEPSEEFNKSIIDLKEISESQDANSNAPIKEAIHGTIIPIPDHQTITANIDQSIAEHKEPATHKEPTPDFVGHSQQVKAPNVEHGSQPKLTEHSPELEAPVVERSPEIEHTEHTSEIAASGIKCKSDAKIESLSLKERSQSKETTPEPKFADESKTIQAEENTSVSEGTLLDLEEAIADDRTVTQQKKESEDAQSDFNSYHQHKQDASEELIKIFDASDTVNDAKDDLAKSSDKFLQEERYVVVKRSTPTTTADDYKLYTEADEDEDIENAAVKVMGMETTAHPADGGEWPRDERPPPPACPASPPPRAPHAAEEVKSIFLETEIPQQSRVLVAQFEEERPRPAAHAPLVVSGKMTLSLIQDAPRETPERDPESTLDEFTTASAVTQPAAEKGEIESDEEIDEEIEVEEIELEEEEEEEDDEEEAPPVKTPAKK